MSFHFSTSPQPKFITGATDAPPPQQQPAVTRGDRTRARTAASANHRDAAPATSISVVDGQPGLQIPPAVKVHDPLKACKDTQRRTAPKPVSAAPMQKTATVQVSPRGSSATIPGQQEQKLQQPPAERGERASHVPAGDFQMPPAAEVNKRRAKPASPIAPSRTVPRPTTAANGTDGKVATSTPVTKNPTSTASPNPATANGQNASGNNAQRHQAAATPALVSNRDGNTETPVPQVQGTINAAPSELYANEDAPSVAPKTAVDHEEDASSASEIGQNLQLTPIQTIRGPTPIPLPVAVQTQDPSVDDGRVNENASVLPTDDDIEVGSEAAGEPKTGLTFAAKPEHNEVDAQPSSHIDAQGHQTSSAAPTIETMLEMASAKPTTAASTGAREMRVAEDAPVVPNGEQAISDDAKPAPATQELAQPPMAAETAVTENDVEPSSRSDGQNRQQPAATETRIAPATVEVDDEHTPSTPESGHGLQSPPATTIRPPARKKWQNRIMHFLARPTSGDKPSIGKGILTATLATTSPTAAATMAAAVTSPKFAKQRQGILATVPKDINSNAAWGDKLQAIFSISEDGLTDSKSLHDR